MPIIDEQFRNDIRAFHVKSQVMINKKKTFITESPVDDNRIAGYKVYGDAFLYSLPDIEPIPLDEGFFERYKNTFTKEGGVYECSGNGIVVTISENYDCYINGEEYGYLYKHELMRILQKCCNINIDLYDDIQAAG